MDSALAAFASAAALAEDAKISESFRHRFGMAEFDLQHRWWGWDGAFDSLWSQALQPLLDKTFDTIPFTALFNITGQPAMSVPLHWNTAGLPVGAVPQAAIDADVGALDFDHCFDGWQGAARLRDEALDLDSFTAWVDATLEQAVAWCFTQARPGDAVLLSPACASLDMFRNYGHRAEVFVSAVQALAADRGEVLA